MTATLPLYDVATLAIFAAGWCALAVIVAALWHLVRRRAER